MFNFIKNPVVRFLITGASLYLIWLVLYYLVIKAYTNWDFYLDYSIVASSQWVLSIFDYPTLIEIESDHVILMQEGSFDVGVWVGDECNGFKLFSIFSIFIIAFPGKVQIKLWFIPLGLIFIHIANVIRVCSLLVIYEKYPSALDFNHLYTFTIFVYSIIFIMWFWWGKKYGRVKKN